jgi:hypothetical protein
MCSDARGVQVSGVDRNRERAAARRAGAGSVWAWYREWLVAQEKQKRRPVDRCGRGGVMGGSD